MNSTNNSKTSKDQHLSMKVTTSNSDKENSQILSNTNEVHQKFTTSSTFRKALSDLSNLQLNQQEMIINSELKHSQQDDPAIAPQSVTTDKFMFGTESKDNEFLISRLYHLIDEESQILNLIKFDYFTLVQTQIDHRMRAILIDWMIQISHYLKMNDETIFSAVNILDNYLIHENVPTNKFQLAGATAMFIASKLHDSYYLSAGQLVYMAEEAFQRSEVKELETKISKQMNFKFMHPTALQFFEVISSFFKTSRVEFMLGKYYLEMSLLSYKASRILPSLVACACAYLSLRYFRPNTEVEMFGSFLLALSATQAEFISCIELIELIMDEYKKNHLTSSVVTKFKSGENCHVSLLV